MPEFRVYGPPGTGKTTYLAGNDFTEGMIGKAVAARGPGSVLVTSFTRAAAQELVSRSPPIDPDMVGTLHAICYRALGRPPIAETKTDEWNEHAPPWARLGKGKANVDDPFDQKAMETPADDLFRRAQVLRARMVTSDRWPASMSAFHELWRGWKTANGYVDFTDMIEMALQEIDAPPGDPSVLMHDEAQDSTPLQWALLRKWAARCDDFIAVGDPDQLLYDWMGATPASMLQPPIPESRKRVLRQSYRMPRAVFEASQKWISQVKQRESRTCRPRDADGQVVENVGAQWRAPMAVLGAVERLLQDHERVMVLASCGYMLSPLVAAMRESGVPFFNPYRPVRGDWNPLRRSVMDRVLAFLRPDYGVWKAHARMWTFADLQAWVPAVRAKGNLLRGAKKLLGQIEDCELDRTPEITWMLEHLFHEQALSCAIDGDTKWFRENLLKSGGKSMDCVLNVLRKRGASALTETPRILVGTIHSVKGGEASAVLLFPDLSPAGDRSWRCDRGTEAHDSVVRTFYVGMTRARETLMLGARSGPLAVW